MNLLQGFWSSSQETQNYGNNQSGDADRLDKYDNYLDFSADWLSKGFLFLWIKVTK